MKSSLLMFKSTFFKKLIIRCSFFVNVYLFLRERAQEGRGREERHKIQSRLQADSTEPDTWLELMDHKIMT